MRRHHALASLLAEVTLAVLLVLLPLAMGSAWPWLLWPLAVLSCLAACFSCLGARQQGQRVLLPWLALPVMMAVGLSLLQLVPLPPRVLQWLSPEGAALRQFVLLPLGLTGWRPVSWEPAATWREVSKHLSYGLVLLAAVQVGRARRPRRRLLAVLAFTGAGLALMGLIHLLFRWDKLFGLFAFAHAKPPFVTPFANPNHLAGYLGLTASVAMGLGLSSETRAKSAPFFLAAVLSGVGVFLSLSRGGVVFFLLGQLLLASWLWLLRRGAGEEREVARRRRHGLAVLGSLLAVLSVAGFVAIEQISAEVEETSSLEGLKRSKVDLWPMMARAAAHFPVLGMGRGAFESAFTRFQNEPNPNILTHPENAVLQLAAEFGAPGLLLLVACVFAFAQLLRRERLGEAELGALAGVMALGLHNLFDFSWELPAASVAALVAVGVGTRASEVGRRGSARSKPSTTGTEVAPAALGRSLGGRTALMGSALLGAGALVALVPGRHQVQQAEFALQSLVEQSAPLDQVRAQGMNLLDRHPGDYLLYALLGEAHSRAGGGAAARALAYVNHTLYLRPRDAGAHRSAARSLLALGKRRQAFLEYRLAWEAGDRTVFEREAVWRARSLEELQILTPEHPEPSVRIATELWNRPSRHEMALAYLTWAEERERARNAEGSAKLWMLEAQVRMQRQEWALAEQATQEAERREPKTLAPRLLRARLLKGQGKVEEALRSLEALRAQFPGEVELGFTLASQQVEAGFPRHARETLQQVSPFVVDFQQRARLLTYQGACFEREGQASRALEAYASAARLAPSAEPHLAIARVSESLRRYEAAQGAVREAIRLTGPEQRASLEGWARRLEEAAEKLNRRPEASTGEEILR